MELGDGKPMQGNERVKVGLIFEGVNYPNHGVACLTTRRHFSALQKVRARKLDTRTTAITLCAAVILCLLTACGKPTPSTWIEKARVTSPDGLYDAVMTVEAVGPVLGGGVYWNVFIVPKGVAAPKDDKNSVLNASVLRGEKLVWKQKHLLEVHYDIAEIEEFQNVWGSYKLQGRGWRPGDYMAEVRLAPSSPDFSLLTPDGDFKPRE
jgi:hypothetical protein